MSITLLIRGLVGLFFAAALAQASELSWEGYFGIVSRYLMIDGLIGAILGMTLLGDSVERQREREMVLGIVMLVDAGGRIASGGALLLWPGIAGFPVTAVMFVAIMAACTASVGLAEAWLTTREEVARHGRGHQAPQFVAGPVGLASLLSIGFGIAAVVSIGSPDRLRALLTGFVFAAAAVSLAMAWSAHRLRGRRSSAAQSAVADNPNRSR